MVKVISLSDKAYSTLRGIKGDHDSFSDVVLKLASQKRGSIMEFAGVWRDNEELDPIFKSVEKARKNFRMRDV